MLLSIPEMRRWLFNFAIVALMAFFSVAHASHCHEEQNSELEFLACCGNSPEGETHSSCGGTCRIIETRQNKTEEKKRVAAPQPEVPRWLTAALITLDLSDSETDRGHAFADVPPEFPKCWQFLARTALPVRAPSLAS